MTQEGLADGRFTKQYVSQIERGEIVPTGELLDWLASRLGVERIVLETGLSTADLERVSGTARRTASSILDEHRYAEALDVFRALRGSLAAGRAALGEAACDPRRDVVADPPRPDRRRRPICSARRAPSPDGPSGSRDEQAEVAYLTAVCCYSLSEIATARDRVRPGARAPRRGGRAERSAPARHPPVALALLPASARLRSGARGHRSRAGALRGDRRRSARARRCTCRRRSSPIGSGAGCSRDGTPRRRGISTTRSATRSRRAACSTTSPVSTTSSETTTSAIAQLREAFAIFVDADLEAEAGYVLSSLAEIHRAQGDLEEAEIVAERALELLEGRIDHVQEIGTAQLVLARAHLEQGELDEAEQILAAVDDELRRRRSRSPTRHARGWRGASSSSSARTTPRRHASIAKQPWRFSRQTASASERLHALAPPRERRTPVRGTTRGHGTSRKREFESARSSHAGSHPPKGPAVMINKGSLLRLVVSLAALASLASLARRLLRRPLAPAPDPPGPQPGSVVA